MLLLIAFFFLFQSSPSWEACDQRCISGNFKLLLFYLCFHDSDGSGETGRCPNTSLQARLKAREMGVRHRWPSCCVAPWEDVLGKNVDSYLGYPETCSPPQVDIKPIDKALSGPPMTYCHCVIPLGNFFCDSLMAILFSPLPQNDMEVAFSA